MSGYAFNYLTGHVTIDLVAPEQICNEGGLGEFYRDPNNPQWGGQICRVLYHESVHFWQFLASGYLANLVADEYRRLVKFETEGLVAPQSAAVSGFLERHATFPFSPHELMECIARYWDVHTRSPAQIIREEDIKLSNMELLERINPNTGVKEYSSRAFDTVMTNGPDCALYAAPYRWMLEKASENRSPEDATYFVALTFPILAHAAFGTPDPVGLFCNAFQRILQTDYIRAGIEEHASRNINFDWLNSWAFIVGEAVEPIARNLGMPSYTSGFDVINRGFLRSHPLFSEYPANVLSIRGRLKMHFNTISRHQSSTAEDKAVADMALRDFYVVFGLPGQPNYRYLLGTYMAPPAIMFSNVTIYARRPAILRVQGYKPGEETYEKVFLEIQKRIRRFRAAEYAVAHGLPANAFG